jgi:hypothetical protein
MKKKKKNVLWIRTRIDLAVLLLDSDQYRIGNANSEPGAWKVTKITK